MEQNWAKVVVFSCSTRVVFIDFFMFIWYWKVALLWSIWRDCIELLWNHKILNVVATCRGNNQCCPWLPLSTQTVQHSQDHTSTPPPIVSWEKPAQNWLKCNVNCAIFIYEGYFGVEICFCDSSRHLAQAHRVFSHIILVIECEATTFLIDMKITINWVFERVAYESDNQYVVHVVLSGYFYENELGTIVFGCRSYLYNPDVFKLAFIRRKVNIVDYNFAKATVFQFSPKEVLPILTILKKNVNKYHSTLLF